ncbi:MAG TPA: hypothetical protein VHK91_00510 [Flavisolibacter sp.]|nr:hypothetical protein [Flavisolibacter sp.]
MVKNYLLLRGQEEFGPFSRQELLDFGIRPSDLIWINGTSTAWQKAESILGLAFHSETEEFLDQASARNIYVSLPTASISQITQSANENSQAELLNDQASAVREEAVEYHVENKKRWIRRWLPENGGMNIAAAFIGIILSAFIISQMINGFSSPASLSQQSLAAIPINQDKQADPTYQNALTTENIPVPDTTKIVKPAKPKNIRKQIQIEGSDYKVGFFGGINNLELTISNNSPHFVDRIEVEVTYYKPNGDELEKANYELLNLKPKSTKVLPVPPTKRGVKVSYKVLNIYSRQYTDLLKQI